MITIKNAKILNDKFEFENADVAIDNGKIIKIAPDINEGEIIDACGGYVLPGLVGVHTHGAVGFDSTDDGADGINEMSKFWAKSGTTTFLPSTTTALEGVLAEAMAKIAYAIEKGTDGATAAGINMEGPYISAKYKGAHREDWLRSPNEVDFGEMQKAARGHIKLVTLAPEVDGAVEFVKKYGDKVCISLGHSGATYEECTAAFDAGAKHVTHMFNAMPSIHHRNLSLIAAAFDKGASVEIIADGLHVKPTVVMMAIKAFGYDKVVLVNDSINATGLPEGRYEFCGYEVTLKDGIARQDDGTICGGTATLWQCVKNVVKWGVPLEMAVKMATYNPAAAIGMEDKIGSIAEGKDADIVIASDALEIKNVFVKGRKIEL